MSKTILIGREVDGTHLVALTLDANGGKPTKTYIGDNVSTSVTRLRLVDNNRWVGHCKIDIENDGSMRKSRKHNPCERQRGGKPCHNME